MDKYREAILEAIERRGLGKTICPSEVLAESEKKNAALMQAVRDSAQKLVEEGLIEATAKGERIDIRSHRGPIRLRKARG